MTHRYHSRTLPCNAMFLILLCSFVFNFKTNAQRVQASKPNIVFILADDVGYYVPQINGGQSYSTPRIDSMARHGMNFKHCEGTPLCSTSRCQLLTGKYNMRNYSNWAYMNPNDKTMANMMRDAGYITAMFGKHQMEYSPDTMRNWGWDYHCIFELTEYKMKYSRYKNPVLMENGTILQGTAMKNKYGDDVLTQKVIDFIKTNKSKPFFVYYSMSIGHAPYCPTPDDPEFAAWNPDAGKSNPSFFPSMMKYMDKKVGQLLDSLHAMGLDNNTLVIYAGDNGIPPEIYYNANNVQHIKGEKGTPREGGTHVPLVAYWPGHVPAGTVNDDLIDFTDFFTTFAQAANVTNLSSYGKLDGVSFYNAMLGLPTNPKQQLFFLFNPKPGFTDYRRWVRDKVYKLYDSTDDVKPKKFYNTVANNQETTALITSNLTPAEKVIKQNFQKILDSMGNWPAAPTLKNAASSNITSTSATVSATIVSSGASPLIDRGSTLCNDNQDGPYLQFGRIHDKVVALGAFSMQRKGLTAQTQYHFTLYAINANQAHSSGFAEDSFYTLSNAPVAQPASFTANAGPTAINLTWGDAQFPATGAKNAGYLLVYSMNDDIQIADDPNGKAPADIVVNGTIIPVTSTVLPNIPANTAKVSGLKRRKTYHFMLIPYTWNGSVKGTYNYLMEDALTLSKNTTFIIAKGSKRKTKGLQPTEKNSGSNINTQYAVSK